MVDIRLLGNFYCFTYLISQFFLLLWQFVVYYSMHRVQPMKSNPSPLFYGHPRSRVWIVWTVLPCKCPFLATRFPLKQTTYQITAFEKLANYFLQFFQDFLPLFVLVSFSQLISVASFVENAISFATFVKSVCKNGHCCSNPDFMSLFCHSLPSSKEPKEVAFFRRLHFCEQPCFLMSKTKTRP